MIPGHHYDAGLGTASRALLDNRGHPDAVEDRRSHADSEKLRGWPEGIP